jgi:hypothetical protein
MSGIISVGSIVDAALLQRIHEDRKTDMIKPPFEFSIPEYLEDDINRYLDAIKNHHKYTDNEEDEIIGSTNVALMGNAISRDQARWIRWYYLEGGHHYDR